MYKKIITLMLICLGFHSVHACWSFRKKSKKTKHTRSHSDSRHNTISAGESNNDATTRDRAQSYSCGDEKSYENFIEAQYEQLKADYEQKQGKNSGDNTQATAETTETVKQNKWILDYEPESSTSTKLKKAPSTKQIMPFEVVELTEKYLEWDRKRQWFFEAYKYGIDIRHLSEPEIMRAIEDAKKEKAQTLDTTQQQNSNLENVQRATAQVINSQATTFNPDSDGMSPSHLAVMSVVQQALKHATTD
jgi:hypothetical protein